MDGLSPQQSGLKWLFLDLNSYFASVEQQDNPSLRGRPVAVVPMETDYTCAIAASPQAKMYGVKTGTIIQDAKRRCPSLICVLARHDAYVRYHHRIIEEIVRHTPINKIWSIDELSSRLPPDKRNLEAATVVARKIKDGLRRNIGECITCSVGVAPNSYLAKVATDMMKPDGLVVLHPEDLPGRLFDLDLTDLPGINVSMEARLHKAGITTVEQLWGISPKHARKIWGGVGGERFWYNLHGYDVPDIVTSRSTIGHSRVLDPDLRDAESARLVARRLTIKAASRLRRENFFATRFYFSARVVDGPRWGIEAHVMPAQDNYTFLEALDQIWTQMMAENGRPLRLKKISIGFLGLRQSGEMSLDLFDAPTRRSTRNQTLSTLVDRVNEKYGAEALRLGVSPKTRAGYVGTKIAFSRVPDMAEFSE